MKLLGRVLKSTGSWYLLEEKNSLERYEARIRGKFRIMNIKNTNPIAVGDWVDFVVGEDENVVITHIHPRQNYIIRKSVNLSKKTQIIASNIDLAFLVVTLKSPKIRLGFIDRFLVSSEAYGIKTVLLFNKCDLDDKESKEDREYYQYIYRRIGYECLDISATKNIGLDKVKILMKDKISVVSGQSGVGKSTLINVLNPGLNIKEGLISDYNEKGQHTTTFAQMYPWPFGGYIIDTPGVKEFGLVEMEPAEIQHYFPEIFKYKKKCKYHNCLHLNEPKCAVKQAVEEGDISMERYGSYFQFLNEEIEE